MVKNNFDDVFYPKNIEEILMKNVDEKMVDHIWRVNKDHLDEIAMTYFGVKITYMELFQNIKNYAIALKKYGLQKGDCITLAMPNCPETVYYIYACNEIGVTAYPIDPRCTFNYMLECINNSNSKLFVCESGTYFSKVARYADKLPVDNKVVVSPLNMFAKRNDIPSKLIIGKYVYAWKNFMESIKNSKYGLNGRISQSDFIANGKSYSGEYKEEYEPEIPAIIVNTSGTTGLSVKGAVHNNRAYNIYANEAQFVTDQLQRGYTFYGYIPYFTMYGSCVGMHVALSYGVVINNVPKYGGIATLEDIIKTKSNIMIGTPNMLEKLTDMYEEKNIDASHVKQYIIGGDSISPERLKNQDNVLMARGMERKLVYGYGATECMPISTFNPDPRSHLYGSAGIVYPMTNIKIIDPETGIELGYNEEGEILVNNLTLMMGYLNNPDENNYVFNVIDGKKYYRTGDRGYLTETGHLYVTGRYKRLMKRPDCHQVSPIPIENAIVDCDIVADCAVIGIKRINGRPGVIPTAFVVVKDSKIINTLDDKIKVVKYIAEEALFKLTSDKESAMAYVFVKKIPYTNNGKIDFKELEKLYFDDLDFYYLDDSVANEYFEGLEKGISVKVDKNITRTLKK